MKKLVIVIEKFMNWLKNFYKKSNGQTFKSEKNYGGYVLLAVSDLSLNLETFASISNPGILESMLKSLVNSNSFKSRPVKSQSDIVSGFKAYIKFKSTVKNLA